MHDAIIVGSGPAGANAAAALVENGKRVLMLDVGDVDTRYAPLVPARGFRDMRDNDPDQHRYLLGDDFEGIPTGSVRTGAQLTPTRLHVTASARKHLPIRSDSFAAAESLALGGLGSAWGAGVFTFDESELADWPITLDDLRPHYEAVARRIGIAADDDDLARFFERPRGALPPLDVDSNAELLLGRYRARRAALNRQGFFMGRPALAVCSVAFGGRGPHEYRDMEFWADADRSVYRPGFTVEELRKSAAFTYTNRQLVLRFDEVENGVAITARNVDTGERRTFQAQVALLAAGTLGTARIVLRSLGRYGERVPLLCNPYSYVPVLNFAMMGREARDRRHSLAQLTAIYQPCKGAASRGSVQVQFYSYRSLLTFRLLSEAPLPYREGLRMMRLLVPMLGILGINHDDSRSDAKYCVLRRGSDEADEWLEIGYELGAHEEARIDRGEKAVIRLFRRLGAWAIKRVRPGHGSSIHYAGTFPMSSTPGALACAPDGRLAPSRRVYLVDGSTFPYLPAKGLTYTIMANANRIATSLAGKIG